MNTEQNACNSESASEEPGQLTLEFVTWVHDALEHLFDMAFLHRHMQATCVRGRFSDECKLQEILLQVIDQLKPPVTISARSPAWRTYNLLNLRYAQGLTQTHVAAQLHISVRYLRYEQQKAIDAVATLLLIQLTPVKHHAVDLAPEQAYVRVDDMLRSALSTLDPILQRDNVLVQVRLPDTPPVMRASSMVARQLFINALGWLTYGLSNCTVHVDVEIGGEQIVTRFERSASVTATGDAADELVNVQQLARQLRVDVQLLEKQSVLEIRLPASTTLRVLVIDDDPEAIELVRRFLQQSNEFELLAAMHPDEAFQKARLLQPACILLDLMMPERDGWEILTLLKAISETASIPVIVSSVLKEHRLSHALGAADVLNKPFTAIQLITALRSVTGQPHPHQVA